MQKLLTGRQAHSSAVIATGSHSSRVKMEPLERRRLLAASVTGIVYEDINADGVRQSSEPAWPDRTIFADQNNNSYFDLGEPSSVSDDDGRYFLSLPPGIHHIGQVVPKRWKATQEAGNVSLFESVTVADTQQLTLDFGSLFSISATLDQTFGTSGVSTPLQIPASSAQKRMVRQPDGKIVVGYADSTGRFTLVRYTSDGALDTTFGSNGVASADGMGRVFSALAVEADGDIIAAGYATSSRILRFKANGVLDTTFGASGPTTVDFGTQGTVSQLLVQPDGKILVAGTYYNGTGTSNFALARLTIEGQLDPSFGGGTGRVIKDAGGNELAPAVALTAAGQIVLAGTRIDPGGERYSFLMRFLASGAEDTTFPKMAGVSNAGDASFTDVAIQPDGKIVAVGQYNKALSVSRFLANGSTDTTFVNNSGRNITPAAYDWRGPEFGAAGSVEIDSAGRIVVAGYGRLESRFTEVAVARYLPSGKLDYSFAGGLQLHTLSGADDAAAGLLLQNDKPLVLAETNSGTGLQLFRVGQFNAPFVSLSEPEGKITVSGTPDRDLVGFGQRGKFLTLQRQVGFGTSLETHYFYNDAAYRADINTFGGDDEVYVHRAGIHTTVNAGDGTDLYVNRGSVGDDAISVTNWSIERLGGPQLVSTGWSGVERIEADGFYGNDTFTFAVTGYGNNGFMPEWSLSGGVGDDAFRVNASPYGVDVHGDTYGYPLGDDQLYVAASAGGRVSFNPWDGTWIGNDTAYFEGTDGPDQILYDGYTATLGYTFLDANTRNLVIDSRGGDDQITLRAFDRDVATRINAGDGNDTFLLSANYAGDLGATLSGGAGDDHIRLDQTRESHGWPYDVTPSTFGSYSTEAFHYDTAETLTILAGPAEDYFRVVPSPTTRYVLDAGGPVEPGAELISIDPQGATGGRLEFTDAQSGQYTFSNRQPVQFTGFGKWDDLVAPNVTSTSAALPSSGPVQFTFEFDQPMSAFYGDEVFIENVATGQRVNDYYFHTVWSEDMKRLVVTYTLSIPTGRYRAVLRGLRNYEYGHPMEQDHVVDFLYVEDRAGADDVYTLRRSADGSNVEFFTGPVAGQPALLAPAASLDFIGIKSANGRDEIRIDASNGNPVPFGGISLETGRDTDLLVLTGSDENDQVTVESNSVTLDGRAIRFTPVIPASSVTGTERLSIATGNGDDTLTLRAGAPADTTLMAGPGRNALIVEGASYTFRADAADTSGALSVHVGDGANVVFDAPQHLYGLSLEGGSARMTSGGSKDLQTEYFTYYSGKLDLADHGLLISSVGDPTFVRTLNALVASASNAGAWDGPGITSSSAKNDLSGLTGLAVVPTAAGGIVVKYTWAADLDGDEAITADDYHRIDRGFLSRSTLFHDGDVNYDSVIDLDDYSLIDQLFLTRPA